MAQILQMNELQLQYDPRIIDGVRTAVLRHASPTRVYLFGSRVTGEAKLESDYDFAFEDPTASEVAPQAIREEIDRLHTLYKIDVVNIAKAETRFANRVRNTGIVVYSASKELRAQDGLMYFDRALERLRIVATERVHWIAEGNGDIVPDVAVKRFEFTYEMAWKALKRVLDFIGIDARAPRLVLKEAYAQVLLADEQVWLDMIEMRNLSSHVYDEHEVARILTQLDRYLAAFEDLRDQLRRAVSVSAAA